MRLRRGGAVFGDRERTHKRERWAAESALSMAHALHKVGRSMSVMVWHRPETGPDGKILDTDCSDHLDPNYLLASQFPASSWHKGLHRWISKAGSGGSTPLLHVDLHGKISEKQHVDIGVRPMQELWPDSDQPFVEKLKNFLVSELTVVLNSCRVKTEKGGILAVTDKPRLCGFRGDGRITTLSQQAAMLGIPAVQIEMPPRLRRRLVFNVELANLFSETLGRCYREIVIPWWTERQTSTIPWPRSLTVNAGFASEVIEESDTVKDRLKFGTWSEGFLEHLKLLEQNIAEKQI